jgi:fibronectin type 3 domain-containing protein
VLLSVRTFGPRHNESPLSNLVAITPLIAPAAPVTLAATATAAGVKLEWTAAPAVAPPVAAAPIGYDVLRRRAGEGAFVDRIAQLGADRLDQVDATAVYGERYEYTVRTIAARDPVVESDDGPGRDLEYRDTFAPPTPTGLVALAEEGRIRLLWDRVEAPDLAGYRLYRQESGEAEAELPREPGAGTDHTDDQVRAGVTNVYRVTAVDQEGNESAKSEPATATPR